MFKRIMAALQRSSTPTVDRLLDQANRSMHKFHLGKVRNYKAALVYRRRAEELYRQAAALKKQQ